MNARDVMKKLKLVIPPMFRILQGLSQQVKAEL